MKVLKLVGLALAGLMGLVILGAVALLLLVDPNRHKGTIESKVRDATGRSFAIEGAVKLNFFPWLALDIGKVTLGNPDGFGAAPLLEVEHARVGARLLPLVRGQLEVSRVALDGLTLNLVRRADAHTNWESLHWGKSSVGGKSNAGPTDLSVAGIQLSHANLTLRDEGKNSILRIRDLDLTTGTLDLEHPTDLALSAREDSGEGTAETHVDLKGRASLDIQHSTATLAPLALKGEHTAAATQPPSAPTPFSVTSPQVRLDWKNGELAAASFEIRVGELLVQADVTGERLFGDRLVSARVRLPEQSPRKIATSLALSLPVMRDPGALSRLSAAGDLRITEKALALSGLNLVLDQSHLKGRVEIEDLEKPLVDVDLSVDAVDVDAYRAPPAAAASAAKPAVAAPLPTQALRAVNARGKLSVGRALVAGLSIADVNLAFSADHGDWRFTSSAKAFGGTSSGEVHLDASKLPVTLSVTEHVRGVDIGAVVKAYAKSDRVSGRANVDVQLAGLGSTDAALIGSLAGPIDFDVKDGALEGLDVTYEIARAQALFQKKLPAGRSGPARTPFEQLSGRSRLERGIVTTDPFRLEARALKVVGKGTFRLSDQAVDYQVTARLDDVPAGLANLKSLEIPVAVTGTVHNYTVRPDVGGIVKGRVKQELEKRKDELRDKLKEQLQNLLRH